MAQGKKISDKIWDKFLEYLSEHTTSVTATCRALSIEARSYYNKRALDKVFADRVDLIFDSIRRPFAEDALFTLIAERNLGAIKFYLNQRGGKRWNDGKILPLTIKHELENPLIKQEKQGVPSHIDDIVAKAYLHIIDNDIGLDDIPEELILDLSGLRGKYKEPFMRKKIIEDNDDIYNPDGTLSDDY